MKMLFDLKDYDGNDLTLIEFKHKLFDLFNEDDDGNIRRVCIGISKFTGEPMLQIYSDDPKLKEDVCLY